MHEPENKKTNNTDSIKQNIRNIQGFPYKEKLENAPTRLDWVCKTIIRIEGENTSRDIIFINYGIYDGLVFFKNDEWHFLPGYFRGLYKDFAI